jgi:hypothetical protein
VVENVTERRDHWLGSCSPGCVCRPLWTLDRRLFVLIAGQCCCWRLPTGDWDIQGLCLISSLSPPTSSPQFYYVSCTIRVDFDTLFQFPVHLLRRCKSIREKDKKGPSRPSARSTASSLQIPGDILAVLQEKVNEFDQSRSADERLSQWLNPTINVLYSLSATLGAGAGLVSTVEPTLLLLPPYHQFCRYSRLHQ